MAERRQNDHGKDRTRRAPARTPEARESQMIALAVDLAETQLRDGTASAQVLSHYLKLASSRERLEQELMQENVELQRAKREQMASAARVEELYEGAINAMRSYAGQAPLPRDDYGDEDD